MNGTSGGADGVFYVSGDVLTANRCSSAQTDSFPAFFSLVLFVVFTFSNLFSLSHSVFLLFLGLSGSALFFYSELYFSLFSSETWSLVGVK